MGERILSYEIPSSNKREIDNQAAPIFTLQEYEVLAPWHRAPTVRNEDGEKGVNNEKWD